ncbi:MAG TPA: hypothetical protein PLY34_02910 [Ferruginibacter sp.]|nr:hypothetical protein [Ferruginibacter sp.]HPH92901.1 hypothetical protein [Ferruginibacter sp.]
MKKLLLLCLLGWCCAANAQEEGNKKNGVAKAVEKTKKINQKTKEINDASNEAAGQAAEAAENVKTTVSNVKKIVKIFEPIINFHFKKKKNKNNGTSIPANDSPVDTDNTAAASNNEPQSTGTDYNQPGTNSTNEYPANTATYQPEYGIPENENYNPDGTMNMGHQNNGQYGNCLNLLEAKVMGMGEAEEVPGKIDLIFLSQYGGLGYSFASPYEAPTINEGVSVKSWRERNETEIAETKLTIAQFEKLTSNTSLVNAVKNARGYAASFFTPNKMDGRVFAVKVQQDNKELYALLAVYKQFGTGGSNGYLQIKIKVQGVDKNGDGNIDLNAYTRQ